MSQADRPYAVLPGHAARRATRWYPDEALERIANTLGGYETMVCGLPWEMLSQEDAAEWLPTLKAGLRGIHRYVAMIEAIAEGRELVSCAACSARFYPSRSDARYCSGRCRMRAHRAESK